MRVRRRLFTTGRWRVRLWASLAIAGLFAAGLSAAAVPASASPSPSTVTYSATETIPAPPSSNFSGANGGGDGWAVGLTATQIFNVFHHNSSALEVNCHNQSDASNCWSGPKTIIDTADNSSFTTPAQPGLTVNQSNGHLYVMATDLSTDTSGAVCIDTTAAASVADPFCGFSALSAAGQAPLDSGPISGVTNPVLVGSNWYSFNEVAGTPTGTEDQMLCFDVSTGQACAGQPYSVSYGGPAVNATEPVPGMTAVGSDIILQVPTTSGGELTCFDTATNATCSGSWPVPVTSGFGGDPIPLLSATGTPEGVCLPNGTAPCWDLSGASVSTPANLASVVTLGTGWNGPAAVIGTRIYVPNQNTGELECYDYSVDAGCANFPIGFSNLGGLYTVNADFQRPSCLWVNSDNGSDQIQNFDAYTGGACGNAPIRVLASSVVAPQVACVPASWTSLQIVSPPPGDYTSGTVTFDDSDGNPIPGVASHTLDSTGTTSLTDLHLSTQYALPQFVVTLTGVTGGLSSVQAKLTWSGTYSDSCVTQNTSVPSATAPQSPRSPSTRGIMGGTTVSWTPPASDGDSPITAYDVTATSVATNSVAGTCTTSGATSCDVTGLINGNTYVFTITAVNAKGSSPAVSVVGFAGAVAPSAPSAPSAPPSSPPGKPSSSLPAPTGGSTAATPSGSGYWTVKPDGAVGPHGSAGFYGSASNLQLVAPVDGISATPNGAGYWLVGKDGGVFTFGDARFFGSMAGHPLNAPTVAISGTPNGAGYWLTAADGGVFTFGDAHFYGSMVGRPLNAPIVGAAPTPGGTGYWLAAADGGVFTFGDARFFGSKGASALSSPVVAIAGTPDGGGYWLVSADGQVFTFGDAHNYGSASGVSPANPVVGIVAYGNSGYRLVFASGASVTFGSTS